MVILGVSISQDQEQPARDFVERYKITFPVGHDTGEIGSFYAVKVLPIMIFVDKSGNLVERHAGELTEEEFRQKVENLLK